MADIVAVPAETRGSYVEWAAIIAGAIVASALSFVLLTAGAAIGLSLVSPYAGRSAGGLAATMAAFWLVFVPILSLLIGGYIAGRMRGAADKGVGSDEVDFRDGIHGLLVWAVSILLGGMLRTSRPAPRRRQLRNSAALLPASPLCWLRVSIRCFVASRASPETGSRWIAKRAPTLPALSQALSLRDS